ncbi:hypothetical protein TRIP_E190123 [uncultured Spirochaetota bacterium]|nr:hypothetical protein TRIP_E190123 [uncultured Spirochaetota bacterium]
MIPEHELRRIRRKATLALQACFAVPGHIMQDNRNRDKKRKLLYRRLLKEGRNEDKSEVVLNQDRVFKSYTRHDNTYSLLSQSAMSISSSS